jgi:hypothetical protein
LYELEEPADLLLPDSDEFISHVEKTLGQVPPRKKPGAKGEQREQLSMLLQELRVSQEFGSEIISVPLISNEEIPAFVA